MNGAALHAGFYRGLPVDFLATCIPMVQHYRTLDAFVAAVAANLRRVGTVACARNLDDWLDHLTRDQLALLYEYEHSSDEAKRQVLPLVVHLFMTLLVGGLPVDEELLADARLQASQRIAAELEVGR
jgi:hypothetical protein